MKTYTLIHQNINGIRTHTQEKTELLTKAYIISIHDTRLKQNQHILQNLFTEYIIHEIKHDTNTGIALLVHKTIKHTLISKHKQDGHKAITIKITDKKVHKQDMYITSYFVPPHNSRHHTLLDTAILQQALHHKYSLLTGDLNARHQNIGCTGTNRHGKQLNNFLLQNTHTILNDTNQPTFIHSAHNFTDCLDYIITTKSLLPYFSSCFTTHDTGSDHLPLTATLNTHNVAQTKNNTRKNTPNFAKTNWKNFQHDLHTQLTQENNFKNSSQHPQNIEHNTNLFIHHIQKSLLKNTPKYKTPNNIHPRLPPHILRLITSRRKIRTEQYKNNSHHLRTQINELNKTITKLITQFKQNMDNTKLQIIQQGPKNNKFWPTLKSFTNPKQHMQYTLKINNETITTPQEKANAFRNHYNDIFTNTETHRNPTFAHKIKHETPDFTNTTTQRQNQDTLSQNITYAELQKHLKTTKKNSAPGPDIITYKSIQNFPTIAFNILINIYNSILETAYFPTAFKKSTISVIPKPNKDPTKLQSYRPITLSSTIGKLLEKIIASRLNTLAITEHVIQNYQTAFRPHRDATENIIHFTQETVKHFNQNQYTLFITFDFKQAFDNIWHLGLLNTIKSFTSLHFTKLIHSFLTNRNINIRIDNTLSTQNISPTQGLPQGSCLSPTLFNIFISTAPHLAPPNTHIYNYADDFSFTSHATNPLDAYTQIQPLIQQFITWTKNYNLTLQSDKTQLIYFTRRRATPNSQFPNITIDNNHIARQTKLKFLGVTFDIHFTFQHHIKSINSGTHYIINTIRHIFTKHKHIPTYIGALLYKTLIRTKFTYAAPILTLIKHTSWRTLQNTEHKALRAATRTGIRTKISTLYNRTNITPIEQYYTHVSQNTLLRHAKNQNHTILSTLKSSYTKRNIAYWTPPLNYTYNTLTNQQQQLIQNSIQHPP